MGRQQAGEVAVVHLPQKGQVVARVNGNGAQIVLLLNAPLRPQQQRERKIDSASQMKADLTFLDTEIYVLDGILFEKILFLFSDHQVG